MEIGIDVGGTKIAGSLVHEGKILKTVTYPTESKKGRSHVLSQLQRVITELKQQDVKGVGIGVPGYFFGTKILALPNLSVLDGVDLKKRLQFPGKLVLGNDAKAMALAEHEYGVAQKKQTAVCITLGTGIGTGVILDGKLWTGRRGKSPELGHWIVSPSTKKFTEGSHLSDWEAVLSGKAILRAHRKRGGTEKYPSEIWKSSSRTCLTTRNEISTALAVFCANIIRVFDPEMIVIAGGVANAVLVKETNKKMHNYSCKPILKLSALRVQGATLGAALLVKE